MARIDLEDLPDSARIRIFASDRPLDLEEERRLLEPVDTFLEGWTSHDTPLTGRDWRIHRFLIVGVDEAGAPENLL